MPEGEMSELGDSRIFGLPERVGAEMIVWGGGIYYLQTIISLPVQTAVCPFPPLGIPSVV
jgi:hypothetical protein